MYLSENSIYRQYLIIDIETVSSAPSFEELPPRIQALWEKKAGYLPNRENWTLEEMYFKRAGIYAEFGKIVCIAAGFFVKEPDGPTLRIKSFADDDEHAVLVQFKELVEERFRNERLSLVAHNGKEFDFPYICRRMLIHDIPIPELLQIRGKKPWEINHLDTMELWKFGDVKHYTSLETLAAVFGIETSKDDLEGSMVNDTYYRQNDLDRIAQYCKRDVSVTAQVFLRLHGLPALEPDRILYL